MKTLRIYFCFIVVGISLRLAGATNPNSFSEMVSKAYPAWRLAFKARGDSTREPFAYESFKELALNYAEIEVLNDTARGLDASFKPDHTLIDAVQAGVKDKKMRTLFFLTMLTENIKPDTAKIARDALGEIELFGSKDARALEVVSPKHLQALWCYRALRKCCPEKWKNIFLGRGNPPDMIEMLDARYTRLMQEQMENKQELERENKVICRVFLTPQE